MANIGLRQAVQNVQKHIKENRDLLGNNLDDLRLEETELSEDNKFWSITFSFNREVDPAKKKIYVRDPISDTADSLGFSRIQNVADLLPQKQTFIIERDYKIFKVDAKTGDVVSMKMYRS